MPLSRSLTAGKKASAAAGSASGSKAGSSSKTSSKTSSSNSTGASSSASANSVTRKTVSSSRRTTEEGAGGATSAPSATATAAAAKTATALKRPIARRATGNDSVVSSVSRRSGNDSVNNDSSAKAASEKAKRGVSAEKKSTTTTATATTTKESERKRSSKASGKKASASAKSEKAAAPGSPLAQIRRAFGKSSDKKKASVFAASTDSSDGGLSSPDGSGAAIPSVSRASDDAEAAAAPAVVAAAAAAAPVSPAVTTPTPVRVPFQVPQPSGDGVLAERVGFADFETAAARMARQRNQRGVFPSGPSDPLRPVIVGTVGHVLKLPAIDYALICARYLLKTFVRSYEEALALLVPLPSQQRIEATKSAGGLTTVRAASAPQSGQYQVQFGQEASGLRATTGTMNRSDFGRRAQVPPVLPMLGGYWLLRNEMGSMCNSRLIVLQTTLQHLMELCEDIHIHQDRLTIEGKSSTADAQRRIRGSREVLEAAAELWEAMDLKRRTDLSLVGFYVNVARPRVLDAPPRPFLFTLETLQEVEMASMGPVEPAFLRERLRVLLPYVPNVVLNKLTRAATSRADDQLAREVLKGSNMSVDVFEHAVVLVVDIKGFSTLAETFEKRSENSPFKRTRSADSGELIAKLINKMFELFLDTIAEFSGDLLKIAGDAVIAAFNLEPDQSVAKAAQQEAAVRCCMCALEIHARVKTLHREQEGSGLHSLHVHSSVAAGRVVGASVGGVDDAFEYFPAGDAFRELRVDLALQDEIVISQRTLDVAGGTRVLAVESRTDPDDAQVAWFLLASVMAPVDISVPLQARAENFLATASNVAALQRYFPRALRPQLLTNTLQSASLTAEMRTVSTVFVMLAGLDLSGHRVEGNDAAWEQVDELVQAIQKIIFRFQGLLRQFLVDDKGDTVIIACFGAPVAHENDPERAVAFAIAALERVGYQFQASGVKAYAGVATGRAFCGTIGAAARHEYAVVGPTVNMAARLMVEASKGIHLIPALPSDTSSMRKPASLLVDAATALADEHTDRSDAHVEFRELPNRITVKGPPAPIAVFAPVPAAPAAPTSLTPLPTNPGHISPASAAVFQPSRISQVPVQGQMRALNTSTAVFTLVGQRPRQEEQLYGRHYELQTLRELARAYQLECCAEHTAVLRAPADVNNAYRTPTLLASGGFSPYVESTLSRSKFEGLGLYADLDSGFYADPTSSSSPVRANEYSSSRRVAGASQSRVRGLLVKGPAGIGKTSLVRRFLRMVQSEFESCPALRRLPPASVRAGMVGSVLCPGVSLYWGGGDEAHRDSRMHAWASIFRQLLRLSDVPEHKERNYQRMVTIIKEMRTSSHAASVRDADRFTLDTIRALTDHIQRTFITLASPTWRLAADASDPNDISRTAEGEEYFTTLLVILLRYMASRRPRVFVLDEGRFFDDDSWRFLTRVMHEIDTPQLMVVLVVRPISAEGLSASHATQPNGHVADIAPDRHAAAREALRTFHGRSNTVDFIPRLLAAADIDVMLCQLWNAASLHSALVEFVRLKTGGNPILVHLLAVRLRSSGLVGVCLSAEQHAAHSEAASTSDFVPGRWCAVRGMPALHQHASVSGSTTLIQAFLDELPADARTIVKIAAVIGRCFSAKILHSVLAHTLEKTDYKLSVEEVRGKLVELQELAIVDKVGKEDATATVGGLSLSGPLDHGEIAAEWMFSSNMFRETAYRQVTDTARKTMHCKIGDCYAMWSAQSPNVQMLAAQSYHYRLAGEIAKAESAQQMLATMSESAATEHNAYMALKGYVS